MNNKLRSNLFLSIALLTVLFWQPATIIAEDSFSHEKLYVQTDKQNYITGENIWFRAYLVNARSHISDTTSHYVYAELINPSKEVIKRIKVRLENGAYSGYIPLTEEIIAGSYVLRFYTQYMTNFDEKYFFRRIIHIVTPQSIKDEDTLQFISTPDSSDEYSVSFHPEGGNIPAGIYTKVAFKAINASGLGENIRGVVVNQNGDTINQFESVHRGLGSFINAANSDEQYFAICRNNEGVEKTFELPKAKKDGISLQLFRQNRHLIVSISKPENRNLPESFYLTLQCRGHIIYSEKWSNDNEITIVPEEILPTGVIQILLTDSDRIPVSERLIFNINTEEKINARFITDKLDFNKREEIKAVVEITDSNNKPLKANFSISIIDNNITRYDASINILSTLLLTSDLKGHIENPAYYFTNENEDTKEHLDLVMLTHGWTRYNVSRVYQEENIKIWKDFETSQTITGTLTGGFFSRNRANDPVSLLAPEYGFFDRIYTDSAGRFRFDNFEFPEGTEYMIQGRRGTEILWDEEIFPAVNENMIPITAADLSESGFENSQRIEYSRHVLDSNTWIIDLEAVTVTANKPERKDRYHPFTSPFTRKIGSEELKRFHAPNTNSLLRSALLEINWNTISSGSQPLILVDNTEVDFADLIGYSAINVESIEYLKTPAETAIFGLRGYGGVILITTSNFRPASDIHSNVTMVVPLGYQITKEFYSPAYTTREQTTNNIPDLRTTVYWNPNRTTREDGKADIHFYASDNPGNYSVIIEGITDEGKIVHSVITLK
jgi:hypothetical protein